MEFLMGLFDDVDDDFTEVEEFANLEAGTYEAIIANVTTEDKESGKYMVITYTVTEDTKFKGLSHKEYQRIYPGRAVTDAEKNSRRAIKTRFVQFGIPEDRINTVEPEDVIGIEGALTLGLRRGSDYLNVRKFAPFQSGPTPTLPQELDEPAPVTQGGKAPKKTAEKPNPFE